MTGDGETVTPLLPEPGVWTGMAQANVWAPLRWKHAKIHRGSRPRILGPHQEAGYTSAVVTVAPNPVSLLQSGGVHIRPHMPPVISRRAALWRRRAPRSMFSRHPDAGRGPPFVSAQTNGCGGDNGGITLSSGFCATILEKDRRFGKTRDER
jgi:hypothetical protein